MLSNLSKARPATGLMAAAKAPVRSRLENRPDELFEAIFDSAVDAMMIIDGNYRIVAINQELEKLTRYHREQVLGQHCYDVYYCTYDTSACEGNNRCPLEGKKVLPVSNLRQSIARADGKKLTVSMTHTLIPSAADKGLYQLVFMQTDRARKQIEQNSSEVIATAAHEVLSHINLIRGYAVTLSSLEEKLAPDQRHRYLRSIESTTAKLTHVIRDFLDLPRIEAGVLYLSPEPSSFSQIVRRVVTEIQTQSADNLIRLHASRALPPVNIDRKKIEQVIINLLINAIKYSPKGNDIEVSIQCFYDERDLAGITGKKSFAEPPCLMLSVKDSGIGIQQSELKLIFDKFYRGDNSVNREIHGIGLGLYICRVIIDAHGGRIWAKSKVGRGSTFYFSLPIVERESCLKSLR